MKVRILEALAIIGIISVAIAMAVPRSEYQKRRDVAAILLSDIDTLRQAVYRFHSDSAYFPTELLTPAIPQGLRAYLPRGFSTNRQYGTLRYRNWPTRPLDEGESASNVIGVTITPADPRVTATAAAMSPSTAQFTVADKLTVILFGT